MLRDGAETQFDTVEAFAVAGRSLFRCSRTTLSLMSVSRRGELSVGVELQLIIYNASLLHSQVCARCDIVILTSGNDARGLGNRQSACAVRALLLCCRSVSMQCRCRQALHLREVEAEITASRGNPHLLTPTLEAHHD